MQYFGSLEAAEKHISAKIFKETLHTSVKILQICMDLQDSVKRSLQNPAEKILQIFTDSQRLKNWAPRYLRDILSSYYYRHMNYGRTKVIFGKTFIDCISLKWIQKSVHNDFQYQQRIH